MKKARVAHASAARRREEPPATSAEPSGVAGTRQPNLRPGPAGPEALRCSIELDDQLDLDVAPDPGLASAALRAVRRLADRAADRAAGRRRYEAVVDGWRFEVTVESALRAALRDRVQRDGSGHVAGGRQLIRAQIPGRIAQVWVAAGDTVEAGARLCSLEAMKMENEIRASRAGTIERVLVQPGSRVELGDELVVIE